MKELLRSLIVDNRARRGCRIRAKRSRTAKLDDSVMALTPVDHSLCSRPCLHSNGATSPSMLSPISTVCSVPFPACRWAKKYLDVKSLGDFIRLVPDQFLLWLTYATPVSVTPRFSSDFDIGARRQLRFVHAPYTAVQQWCRRDGMSLGGRCISTIAACCPTSSRGISEPSPHGAAPQPRFSTRLPTLGSPAPMLERHRTFWHRRADAHASEGSGSSQSNPRSTRLQMRQAGLANSLEPTVSVAFDSCADRFGPHVGPAS